MSGVSKQLINLLVNREKKKMFRINVGVFKPGEQRFTLSPGSSANPSIPGEILAPSDAVHCQNVDNIDHKYLPNEIISAFQHMQ